MPERGFFSIVLSFMFHLLESLGGKYDEGKRIRVRYHQDHDIRREAVEGKRERVDPTSKSPVECRIISGLHTFHVSAHYTHEAHCSSSLSSSPSAKSARAKSILVARKDSRGT